MIWLRRGPIGINFFESISNVPYFHASIISKSCHVIARSCYRNRCNWGFMGLDLNNGTCLIRWKHLNFSMRIPDANDSIGRILRCRARLSHFGSIFFQRNYLKIIVLTSDNMSSTNILIFQESQPTNRHDYKMIH